MIFPEKGENHKTQTLRALAVAVKCRYEIKTRQTFCPNVLFRSWGAECFSFASLLRGKRKNLFSVVT